MHIWLLALCLTLLAGCANDVKLDQFTVEKQTVADEKTALMWAESDNRDSLTWQDAVDYCESFEGGGFQDWRMPSQAELQSLIATNVTNKEKGVIDLSSNMVWASEIDGSKAAFCNFKSNRCSWMEQAISISLRALPVRHTNPQAEQASATPSIATPVNHPQTTQQRLQMLDILNKQDLITPNEYQRKRTAILDEL